MIKTYTHQFYSQVYSHIVFKTSASMFFPLFPQKFYLPVIHSQQILKLMKLTRQEVGGSIYV